MRRVDRRRFLGWLGSGAAAGAASPVLLAALLACARRETLAGALVGSLAEPGAARAVGRRVLALRPGEADADTLVRRLARGDVARWTRLAESEPGALAAELRARHRADFAEGRLADVGGWVLSRTEARLFALCAAVEPG